VKWWYWLILELLILFEIMAWIYFFPGDIEYDFYRALLGFDFIYLIEKYRKKGE
jgi:hypothetical protein